VYADTTSTELAIYIPSGAELGGARGATAPQNFAWPPQNFPRDVMPLHLNYLKL